MPPLESEVIMDVVELKDKRIELEGNIALQVAELVSKFRKETGISIENVSVYMARVTAMGDSQEEYIVSSVSCKIAF